MGGAFSNSYVSNVVTDMTNIVVTSSTDCITIFNQTQLNDITVRDSVFFAADASVKQTVSINLQCLASTATQNNVNVKMKDYIKQVTSAMTQQFSLSSGEANAVATNLTALGQNVINQFYLTCCTQLVQQQVNTITGDNSVIFFAILNLDQTIGDVSTCVNNSSASTNITNAISIIISQKTSAVVQSFLGPLLIIAIIALLIFLAISGIEIKWIIIIAIIVIVGYFVAAFIFGWWPFHKKN